MKGRMKRVQQIDNHVMYRMFVRNLKYTVILEKHIANDMYVQPSSHYWQTTMGIRLEIERKLEKPLEEREKAITNKAAHRERTIGEHFCQ